MNPPYIIGELGSCHEEALARALSGINVAKAAGCDAYKVQYWSSATRMRERRHVTGLAYETGSIKVEWFQALRDQCHAEPAIDFACTVYLLEDVETVACYVDAFKISSFEARDRELTKRVLSAHGDRPVFLSTGMQGSHDSTYLPKTAIRLHCVSAYPCPVEEANVGAVELGEGYSDHTRCILTGAFAVSAGARFLEVHYRLDETSTNCADYVVALTPRQLQRYVQLAHAAHIMWGTGKKEPMPSERTNMAYRVVT